MQRHTLSLLTLSLLIAGSCPTRQSTVVMERTADDQVERRLAIGAHEDNADKPPEADMLAQARAAYGEPAASTQPSAEFAGKFRDFVPADLTHQGHINHGFVSTLRTNLGSVTLYAERMPGPNRPIEPVRSAQVAADLIARALAAYVAFHPELAATPENTAYLVDFLESEFRDDVLNVGLLIWQAVAATTIAQDAGLALPDDAERRMSASAILPVVDYLVEHDYLRPEEAVLLEDVFPERVVLGLLRKCAVLLGHPADGPWPPELACLAEMDNESLGEIMREGLAIIGASEESFEVAATPLFPVLFETLSSFTVTWRGPAAPLRTNGTWDADKKELSWTARGRETIVPAQMLYAVWAEPAEEYQQVRLGRVGLRDQALYEYVKWFWGLTARDQAAWEEFVDEVRPGEGLVAKLERFRLPDASASSPKEPVVGARQLIEALKSP